MEQIIINGIYKHFKGNYYKVLDIAKDSETLEDIVIYQSLDGLNTWTRPATQWFDKIDKNNVRFLYVDACII